VVGEVMVDTVILNSPKRSRGKTKRSEYFHSENRIKFVFLSPALLIIIIVLIIPLIYALIDSFYKFNLSKIYEGRHFIGFSNYINAFKDPYFLNAILVSAIITVAVVSLELIIGIFLALLLNKPLEKRLPRGKKVFRTLAILPLILPPVIVGLMWRFMYQYSGIINYLLKIILSIDPINWTTKITGIISIIIATVWQNVPFSFLLILAGLQAIPQDLVEAAMVDGSTDSGLLRHIYLPLLKPFIFVILTIRTMDVIRLFDEAYILTGGGPGRATETISLFIYTNSFKFFNIGYGNALSTILLLLLMIVAYFYMRMIYGGEEF
jgi:multiple sugar transport system permease protein